jgi:uncharacterized protein
MAGSLLWVLAGYPAWVESTVDVSTEQGPATVVLDKARKPTFLLVMTHGAGGGVDSADVLAARDAAARAPGNAGKQDAAWLEIIIALRKIHQDVPLVQGGRSNGARVACRTAGSAGAQGVIALAFPLHPPGRPESSRADELRHAGVPVLVVNGASDPFGIPAESDADRVVVLPGETHSLSRAPRAVRAAVTDWLSGLPWLAAG